MHQRTAMVTHARVYNHARSLIYHDNIVVLVDDVQGHFGGGNLQRLCLGDGHFHPVTGFQTAVFLAGLAIAPHLALLNELLGGTSA